jgi:hypothetical protein
MKRKRRLTKASLLLILGLVAYFTWRFTLGNAFIGEIEFGFNPLAWFLSLVAVGSVVTILQYWMLARLSEARVKVLFPLYPKESWRMWERYRNEARFTVGHCGLILP